MNNTQRQQVLQQLPAIDWPPMNPRVNTTVRAADRAAEIIRRVWGFTAVEDGPWVRRADAAAVAEVLFDHARVPELAWKADVAAEDSTDWLARMQNCAL